MKIADIFDVTNLAVVVTGAASGIGLAYAEAMADNGAKVTLIDVDAERLERETERLREETGANLRTSVVDVTDRRAVERAFNDAAEHYGRLDVVFANAGIDGGPAFLAPDGSRNPSGAIENLPPELWDNVIRTNLTSAFLTIQAAVRHMKKQPAGGRIIVTSSVAALGPAAIIGTPYMPSKAGIVSVVRQAALELAKYNISVNAILPGAFRTNIASPGLQETLGHASPMHRLASTDEIQGLALFLASSASSYITGAQMVIDGGVTLGPVD